MALLLLQRDATVTICHSQTADLAGVARRGRHSRRGDRPAGVRDARHSSSRARPSSTSASIAVDDRDDVVAAVRRGQSAARRASTRRARPSSATCIPAVGDGRRRADARARRRRAADDRDAAQEHADAAAPTTPDSRPSSSLSARLRRPADRVSAIGARRVDDVVGASRFLVDRQLRSRCAARASASASPSRAMSRASCCSGRHAATTTRSKSPSRPRLVEQRDVGDARRRVVSRLAADDTSRRSPLVRHRGWMMRFELAPRGGVGEDDAGRAPRGRARRRPEDRGAEARDDGGEPGVPGSTTCRARATSASMVGSAQRGERAQAVGLAGGDAAGERDAQTERVGHVAHCAEAGGNLRLGVGGRRDALFDERVPLVAVRALPEQLGAAVAAAHADVRVEIEHRLRA